VQFREWAEPFHSWLIGEGKLAYVLNKIFDSPWMYTWLASKTINNKKGEFHYINGFEQCHIRSWKWKKQILGVDEN